MKSSMICRNHSMTSSMESQIIYFTKNPPITSSSKRATDPAAKRKSKNQSDTLPAKLTADLNLR